MSCSAPVGFRMNQASISPREEPRVETLLGMSLLADAYGCHCCPAAAYRFEPAPNGGGYLKFSPTIGSTGFATVLFMGINPYRVERNQWLYEDAMASLESFATLAGNREPHSGSADGPRYIRRSGDGGPSRYGHEPFYNQYMDIVEGVWGTGTPFEAHAAATELYLCSTPDTRGRPFTSDSECAGNFFAHTFAQVDPER